MSVGKWAHQTAFPSLGSLGSEAQVEARLVPRERTLSRYFPLKFLVFCQPGNSFLSADVSWQHQPCLIMKRVHGGHFYVSPRAARMLLLPWAASEEQMATALFFIDLPGRQVTSPSSDLNTNKLASKRLYIWCQVAQSLTLNLICIILKYS